jgi:hypothetical protein
VLRARNATGYRSDATLLPSGGFDVISDRYNAARAVGRTKIKATHPDGKPDRRLPRDPNNHATNIVNLTGRMQ